MFNEQDGQKLYNADKTQLDDKWHKIAQIKNFFIFLHSIYCTTV